MFDNIFFSHLRFANSRSLNSDDVFNIVIGMTEQAICNCAFDEIGVLFPEKK